MSILILTLEKSLKNPNWLIKISFNYTQYWYKKYVIYFLYYYKIRDFYVIYCNNLKSSIKRAFNLFWKNERRTLRRNRIRFSNE
jgi:hypothetical protein